MGIRETTKEYEKRSGIVQEMEARHRFLNANLLDIENALPMAVVEMYGGGANGDERVAELNAQKQEILTEIESIGAGLLRAEADAVRAESEMQEVKSKNAKRSITKLEKQLVDRVEKLHANEVMAFYNGLHEAFKLFAELNDQCHPGGLPVKNFRQYFHLTGFLLVGLSRLACSANGRSRSRTALNFDLTLRGPDYSRLLEFLDGQKQ